MRNVEAASVSDRILEIEAVYGRFDLGLDGLPTPVWEGRNIKKWKPPGEMMQHCFFPSVYLARIRVNRRMFGPLSRAYEEIVTRWSIEARRAHGLDQFVKCYCFGDGALGPNLFWYGAAWEVSPQVGGEVLTDMVKIFTRHGFTHAYTADKRAIRIFELW